MSSPFGLEPHDYEEEALALREQYEARQAIDIDPIDINPPTTRNNPAVDVANLLFGDEMATVGVSFDNDGFRWSLERAKDFWVEHPFRAGLAAATTLLPAVGLATRSYRTGRALAISDDVVRSAGMIDDSVDITRMSERTQEMLRVNLDRYSRYKDRMERIELAGDAAPLKDRAFAYLNKSFNNTYMEQLDPQNAFSARAQWVKTTNQMLEDQGYLSRHLADLPPDEIGPLTAQFFLDPSKISNIPRKYQPWAIRAADDLRATQAQGAREGFLHPSEIDHIGDVWFSTVRSGTRVDSEDALSTLLDVGRDGRARVLRVPRTSSPNLINRKLTKQETSSLVAKQSAADMLGRGKKEEALRILRSESGFDDAIRLIERGSTQKAIQLLSKGGSIDLTPKSIVFKSLFQQKMLLENFRLVRDVALNPDITKPADAVKNLNLIARRRWMNLDTLPGADRVRRMVAVSQGKDAVDELGWVPKSIYRELHEISGGGHAAASGDFLELLTSIHKTSSTAFNIPTHFQNALGNYAFLVNIGINPLSREFIDLQKRSLRAVSALQRSYRSNKPLTDIGDLGTLPSLAGGRAVSIAEEIASPELGDLVEMSSVLSAEGVGIFERLGRADNFTGALARLMNTSLRKTKGYIATDAYIAEDAVPKMAYFLKLRQEGLSRTAATLEVGKRMPMYHSVGQALQGPRKWLLPWVTFPAEAARILKNNLMDHPLKTAMMLQMPEIAQVGLYSSAKAMGQPTSFQDIEQRKDQLAEWAYRPTTVITPLRDRNSDIRAATLDFLPYASVMPPTLSRHAGIFNKLPFGADEPMPILGGLYLAMTGRDAWGRDIPTDPNSPSQKVAALTASLMDFMAPPFIRKYAFNTRDPEAGYRLFTDLGRNVNVYTEKPGDPVFDFFINNLSPVRMYAANPEQQLANEAFAQSRISSYRSRLSRDWSALLKSGDTAGAADIMRQIAATFSQEWNDPAVAQSKMSQWLKNHSRTLSRHPQLRGFSKQELIYRIEELTNQSAQTRTRARQQLIDAMQRELRLRGRQSRGGSKNPFVPDSLLGGEGTIPPVLQGGGGLL